jgi:excisionase family DNA binding protein
LGYAAAASGSLHHAYARYISFAASLAAKAGVTPTSLHLQIGFSRYELKNHTMEKITFEQLPEAVALILEKVSRIEKMLSKGKGIDDELKPMLTITEAAEYMGLSLSSMYKMTHRRELPVYKPSGGKVYLKREDINAYLSKHRLMSQTEIEKEATNYVTKNPKSFDK